MERTIQEPVDNRDAVQEIEDVLSRELEAADTTDALIPVVYDELRKLAAQRLAHEKPGQTMQATALVNEAYIRLVQVPHAHWENKRHFFCAAAEAMRRVLVENARRKKAKKRGGSWYRTDIDVSDICVCDPSDEVLLVHEVLDRFSEVDPQSAELVKLRFFAGFTQQQCADILGVSKRTADNRWAFARAWLFRAVQEGA